MTIARLAGLGEIYLCSGEIKKRPYPHPSPYGYGRADLAAQI